MLRKCQKIIMEMTLGISLYGRQQGPSIGFFLGVHAHSVTVR